MEITMSYIGLQRILDAFARMKSMGLELNKYEKMNLIHWIDQCDSEHKQDLHNKYGIKLKELFQ